MDCLPNEGGALVQQKVKKPLPKMDPCAAHGIAPGAVCRQWKKCGKPGCKCARGELHGPYYYRFYWCGGRMVKYYVRKADLAQTLKDCAGWHTLQAQIRENRISHRETFRQMRAYLRAMGA